MSNVRDITINGVEFQLEVPYSEGHILSAAEASQLNQVYLENVGNNFRSRVKELLEAGSASDAIQAELDKYADTYEFGSRRVGSGTKRVADPVMREMRAMAKTKLVAFVKEKQGVSWNDLSADEREALLKRYIEKNDAALRPIAERRVADAKEVADLNLD
jgi:hypothetical protein